MSHSYLRFPAAPNLPLAPERWDRQYQDQFANVLRLYFNQISKLLQDLSTDEGGYHLSFPLGAFDSSAATTLTASIPNGTSTAAISVASTKDFQSSGYILIENEVIQYTSKTATTLDGTVTRGVLGTTASSHTNGLSVTQAFGTGSPTTIGTVYFTDTDHSVGIKIGANTSHIVFDRIGIYNIQVSIQFLNFTTSEDNVTTWFAINGNNLTNSGAIEQVNSKHGTEPGAAILTYNIIHEAKAGDYLQVKWASDTGNTIMATYPAGTSPVHPESPAIILTATFVSAPTE